MSRLIGHFRSCGLRWLVAAFVLCLVVPPASASAKSKAIRIGWTAWSDAELVTKLAQRLINIRLGHDVDLILTDIALQYQGIARGDLDVMLMAWLPDTHADYHRRFAGQFVDLGPIYTGAKLGWVVPAYVPIEKISSIADLARPEIADRLNRQIYGIDPGAGLMRLSERAIKAYNLPRYHLIASSGAAMTAMVERAHRRKRWIVATAWRPHWMFHVWKLRFLEDPKGVLGGREAIHAIVRQGLGRAFPDVFDLLVRMYIPLNELEMAIARAKATGYDAVVSRYIAEHPSRITYWLTGKID